MLQLPLVTTCELGFSKKQIRSANASEKFLKKKRRFKNLNSIQCGIKKYAHVRIPDHFSYIAKRKICVTSFTNVLSKLLTLLGLSFGKRFSPTRR